MLRKGFKCAKAAQTVANIKSLAHVSRFGMRSADVNIRNSMPQERKKINYFNLIGDNQATSAWIVLNRDHKYNTLSDGMITDLKRFMESYESDQYITGIWLQNQGTVFSKGMDLKYILYKMSNGQASQAYDYLRQVYDFSMFYGSFNKPMITILDGEMNNAGASIFIQRPHLIATPKTTWALNETGLGYIPDCGSTHFLSRMPNEIGTYLALTGKQIDGKELRGLQLVYNYTEEDIVLMRKEFIHENRRLRPISSENIYGDKDYEAKSKRYHQEEASTEMMREEFYYRVGQKGENAKLVLADLKYRKATQDHANSHYEAFKGGLEKELDEQKLLNHTKIFETTVLNQVIRQKFNTVTSLPGIKINKCFKGRTVEEIFKALEEDGSAWAQETLDILKTKSPMSLKLTLRLLREGLNSQWGECFQREYRVACRRFNDEEFQNALKVKLDTGNPEFSNWTYKTLESITPEMVDKYFAPLEQDIKIPEYQPTLPPHSLAPAKEYYNVYPDMVRYWLNKQSIRDWDLRESQLFDVKAFMKKLGIDPKNTLLNHDLIRERVYKTDTSLRKSFVQLQRVFEIVQSPAEVKNYRDTRIQYIESFFRDEKHSQEYIHEMMTTMFQEKYEQSVKRRREYAEGARKLEKKKVFEKIRDAISKGRFVRDVAFKPVDARRIQKLSKNFGIPLFFPSNATESFLDVPNPDITSLHPYAKYVNNVELVRKYDHESYELFLQGVISEAEYTNYVVNGELPKDKVPSPTNLEKAFRAVNRQMDDLKMEAKQKDLNTLWGVEPTEIARKEKRLKEFMTEINKNHQSIGNLLKKSSNLKKYVVDAFMSDTLRARGGEEVDLELEHLIPNPDYEGFEKYKERLTKELPKTDETFDSFINTVNFVDLQPEKLNPREIQHIYPDNKSQNTTLGAYEEQLLEMLKLDDVLKDCLDPIFGVNESKRTKSFSDFFRNLLVSVYKKKVDSVLQKEQVKYRNIKPLFTQDGESVLQKGEKENDAFMETIDDFIAKNALFEFNRYISSHVFFVFGFLGLLELEKLYNGLGKIVTSANRGPFGGEHHDQFEDFASLAKFLKEKNINISNSEDLSAILAYLNKMSSCFSQLFLTYKDQLHFTEDILLDKYVKIKYSMARYNSGMKNRKNFIHTVLESFKDQQEVLQEIQVLNAEVDSEHYFPKHDQNAYKLALLTFDEVKDQNIEVLEDAIQATEAYFNARTTDRMFVPGVANYLVDLERATKSAIYGKYNAFPTEYHFTDKEVIIPEYFDRFDLREPIEVWFDKKLKEVLNQYLVERSKFQEILTTEELIALDKDLMRLLTPQNIQEAMIGSFDNDISILNYHGSVFDQAFNNESSMKVQDVKAPVAQKDFNKSVKNPDALNKYIAYAITMYDKYKKKSQKNINTLLIAAREQVMHRIYREAFKDPAPVSSMSEFTQGKGEGVEEIKQRKMLTELKNLKEHNIDKNTSIVMHSMLQEFSKQESRKPELRKELEYLFKRHDIVKDYQR